MRGKYNGDGVGVEEDREKGYRLYNPRNTGCNARHIPTKDESAEGRRVALDYRIN